MFVKFSEPLPFERKHFFFCETVFPGRNGKSVFDHVGDFLDICAALLGTLEGKPQRALKELLAHYRGATGTARVAAEEALLDFFLDHGDE